MHVHKRHSAVEKTQPGGRSVPKISFLLKLHVGYLCSISTWIVAQNYIYLYIHIYLSQTKSLTNQLLKYHFPKTNLYHTKSVIPKNSFLPANWNHTFNLHVGFCYYWWVMELIRKWQNSRVCYTLLKQLWYCLRCMKQPAVPCSSLHFTFSRLKPLVWIPLSSYVIGFYYTYIDLKSHSDKDVGVIFFLPMLPHAKQEHPLQTADIFQFH